MVPKLLVAVLLLGGMSVKTSQKELKDIEPVDLNYECVKLHESDDDRSPILLIHGLALAKENWNGIYEVLALETKRKVCLLDLRNHGESPQSEEADVAAMTADIHHLVEKLNFSKVSLLGHSLGGKIAIHYAVNYPERVDQLGIEDMRPNNVPFLALLSIKLFMKLHIDAIALVPRRSTVEQAQKFVANYINNRLWLMRAKERVTPDATRGLPIRCSKKKCEWKSNVQLLKKVMKDPLPLMTKSEGVFNGPTRFFYGTKSLFKVNRDERNILQLLPNATLVPIKGAGHIIHGMFKEYLVEVVKFFNE